MFQEFYIEIKDNRGSENRINIDRPSSLSIRDSFPNEYILEVEVKPTPWYVHIYVGHTFTCGGPI